MNSGPFQQVRAWATPSSTRSSPRWPRRTSGTPRRPVTTPSTRDTSPDPSWPASSRCSGCVADLAAYSKDRADLLAILLTGIPSGVVPGFQNYTGTNQADMFSSTSPRRATHGVNPIGLIAGDAAGFPNGRRPIDGGVIELRAVAGATIPLVDPSFTPDAASAGLTDGTTNTNPPSTWTPSLPRHPRGGARPRPAHRAARPSSSSIPPRRPTGRPGCQVAGPRSPSLLHPEHPPMDRGPKP